MKAHNKNYGLVIRNLCDYIKLINDIKKTLRIRGEEYFFIIG